VAPARIIAITNAHVVPVEGEPYDGSIVITDGKISAVGRKAKPPRRSSVDVLDAEGGWVLPGFVDAHTHVGVWNEGEGWSGQDTNEMTDPVTAQVRALDAVYPGDLGFTDALTGGITTVCVNPGSGNVIGGHCVAVHTHGRTVDEMVLRSPVGLKSALGENPKRVYGDQKKTPSTRLGNAAVLREAFVSAQNYQAKRAAAAKDKKPFDARDLKLEALASVLDREIPWRQHSHRADDIATAMRIAEEFGYELVIDHGTEAHLIADLIAEKGIPVLIGPLIVSRSKVEVRNRSTVNPGLLARAGVEISIITDHPVCPINHLVLQATLAVRDGLDRDTALRAITINPAKVLGLDDRIGSLAVGKLGDVVLWSGDPLDVMQRAQRVFIEGRQAYAHSEPAG
jgi:imidazolonepropionase-like amidohydrolase